MRAISASLACAKVGLGPVRARPRLGLLRGLGRPRPRRGIAHGEIGGIDRIATSRRAATGPIGAVPRRRSRPVRCVGAGTMNDAAGDDPSWDRWPSSPSPPQTASRRLGSANQGGQTAVRQELADELDIVRADRAGLAEAFLIGRPELPIQVGVVVAARPRSGCPATRCCRPDSRSRRRRCRRAWRGRGSARSGRSCRRRRSRRRPRANPGRRADPSAASLAGRAVDRDDAALIADRYPLGVSSRRMAWTTTPANQPGAPPPAFISGTAIPQRTRRASLPRLSPDGRTGLGHRPDDRTRGILRRHPRADRRAAGRRRRAVDPRPRGSRPGSFGPAAERGRPMCTLTRSSTSCADPRRPCRGEPGSA